MIIVDTSILIDAFRGDQSKFLTLRKLHEKDELLILSPILAELLQGAKSQSEVETIKQLWLDLPKINESSFWIDAGINSFKNKWKDKGVGIIDGLLISIAWRHKYKIWTLDKKLISVAGSNFIFSC